MQTTLSYDKVTFTIPRILNQQLENIKKELKVSKSEVLKNAVEEYLQKQEKAKIQKSVELMMSEYKTDKSLTEFTTLDGEDFR
ncbi:Ribbon-helix-helix protein, copG family [Thiovulum sp. ES]|nr:Ribbon-helix-helix protein, copG family [Thiovulum sp. ES]